MIRNYIKIAFRHLSRNKAYAILNVSGLTLGMTCGLLIFLLVKYHLGFDNFHANADRIYRIVTEQHRDNVSYTAGVPSPLGKAFRNDYTFAEKVARIATFAEMLVTVKQGKEIKKFSEPDGVVFAEEEFFQIFNYPLIEGDIRTALEEPNTGIITERLAKKYFGNQNPINQTFRFDNKIDVTVRGVLKDLPVNTDRRTEIYVSYNTLKQYNEWLGGEDAWGGIQSSMNCYALLRPGVSTSEVEKVFPTYVKNIGLRARMCIITSCSRWPMCILMRDMEAQWRRKIFGCCL